MKNLFFVCCLFAVAVHAQTTDDLKKMKGGTISKVETALLWGVQAILPNFEFDAKFNVTKYYFVLVKKNGEIFSATNVGAFFNDKIKQLITMCRPGDLLVFDNIKAKGPDNYERPLGQIVEKVF